MPFTAQHEQDIKKQYDPMRARAQQAEAAQLQTQKDAMARRAAQLGGGPSGSFIKQEGLATDASAKRLQAANEGIDAQQQGAVNQARQVHEQRDWQTGERVAGQDFAKSERIAGMDFANRTAAENRAFQTSERLGSQEFATKSADRNYEFQKDQNAANRIMQQKAMDLGAEQWKQSFDHEKEVDAFNMDMANKMYKKKDLLEQLFGNFSGASVSGGWKKIFGGGGDTVFGGEGWI